MTRFGYLLPTRELVMGGEHGTPVLLERAKLAEQLGFHSLWVGDSLLARPRHDPLTLLAAIAIAAPTMTIGTAILLPALRNPVLLAQQLATLDQISEGRLVVGAGIAGDNPAIRAEFAAAGVPFEKRVGTLLEGFRVCRALWQGEPVDRDGRWPLQQAVLAPKPYRPDGPPIWLAASVPQGIERAARHFDGWFPIGPDLQKFSDSQRVYQDACAAHGKTGTTAIYLTVAVNQDSAAADAAINSYLESYYSMPAAVMRKFQACCGGSLVEVADFIRSFAAAGASDIVLRLVGEHEHTLQALARELLAD